MVPTLKGTVVVMMFLSFLSRTSFAEDTLDLERVCIDEIVGSITSKAMTCQNVTDFFLRRIHRYNGIINAVVTLDETGAREQARKLDEYFHSTGSVVGRLHCVPVLVKDNILVKGLPTTLGLAVFSGATAEVDAPAVDKVRKAGGVILGKANMTPLAVAGPNDASQTGGLVSNPYALNYSCSASSNGNAAALAARLAVLGLASDSFGSVVGPSSVVHIVGYRPVVNDFDMSGVFPLRGPDFDTIGLMALKMDDIQTLFDVLSENHKNIRQHVPESEEPVIRVGILGNVTFGHVNNKKGHYALPANLQDVFLGFENKLRDLENVAVDLTWDDEIISLLYNMTGNLSAACSCMAYWSEQFWRTFPMSASNTEQRIDNLTTLYDAGLCVDDVQIERCDDSEAAGWQLWVSQCASNGLSCGSHNQFLQAKLHTAQRRLKKSLFSKFDVIVFTFKPQMIMRSGPQDSDFFLSDFGSTFAFPSLTVPIGFTEAGEEPALPMNAYFLTTPEKNHKMLSLAKKYEDSFWAPCVPEGFR